MKPLLVGEDNPFGSDPRYALYPYPEHCTGGRLQRLIFDVPRGEYMARYDRANLCLRKWNMREARTMAKKILEERDCLVLLGAKVATAFGLHHKPFTWHEQYQIVDETTVRPNLKIVQLPHPSGRCRAWNVLGSYDRARSVLAEAGVIGNLR